MKKATVEKATSAKKANEDIELVGNLDVESSNQEDFDQWLHSHDKLKINLKGNLTLDEDEYAQEELDEEELEEETGSEVLGESVADVEDDGGVSEPEVGAEGDEE